MDKLIQLDEALQRLRESEERFRQLADNITDVFWMTSPDLSTMHYVSPGFELIWGRSTESLYAHPHLWLEVIFPEDLDRVGRVFATLMGDATQVSVEYRILRPDGSIRWIQDRGFQVRDAAGKVIRLTGIASDITERKQSEDDLQRQQTELRVLFDLIPAMIWFKDTHNGILRVNQRVASAVGKTVAEIEGRSSLDIYPHDAASFYADDLEVIRSGAPKLAYVETLRSADGDDRWVQTDKVPYPDKDGNVVGIVVMAQDITARKRAEEVLLASEARLRFLNDLTEATGTLVDPERIIATISRMLGEHLRASRCAYADVHGDGEQFTILHDFTDGCASTVGKHPLSILGERAGTMLRGGQTLIVRNVDAELPPSDGLESFHALGIQAIISCPLVKGGRLRAILTVHHATPRDWQAAEIALVQEILERCWAMVEGRRTEEALRTSESRFSGAFEHAPIGMALVSPEGRWLKVNQALCDVVGYSEAELLTRTFQDITHPDDLAADLELVRRLLASEIRSYSMDKRYIHARGHLVTVSLHVSLVRDGQEQPLYFIAQIQDITERKRADILLRESQQRLALAQTSGHIGIWDWDVVTNTLVWDTRMYELYGIRAQEFSGAYEAWQLGLHPDDRKHGDAAIHAALDGIKDFHIEFRVVWPNGEVRHIEGQALVQRASGGSAVRMIGVNWDITDRKRADARLAESHQDLVKASRLAGMAEVATGILHNVGNVLNSVNVASSCVADGIRKSKAANLSRVVGLLREHEADLGAFLTTDPKGKQIPSYLAQLAEHLVSEQTAALKELGHLQHNIEHIKDIVAMQQGFAKVSGATETLSVADLVEDALKLNASALAQHDIVVIKELQEVPLITAEKHQVLQILVNLVRNAQQACDPSEQTEKRMTIRVTQANDCIRIAVIDNGTGISTAHLKRIFSHGFTTKAAGHGFGLHNSALAAKAMGGSLTVHSDGPGRGATFTLELPLPDAGQRK